jgi:hypothetical protein
VTDFGDIGDFNYLSIYTSDSMVFLRSCPRIIIHYTFPIGHDTNEIYIEVNNNYYKVFCSCKNYLATMHSNFVDYMCVL